MTIDVLKILQDSGLGPIAQSEECLQAMSRPPMPRGLEPIDVVGIHWELCTMELIRRFPEEMEKDLALRIAVLFVLRECEIEGELTPKRVGAAFAQLCEWHTGRFHASGEKLRLACREDVDSNPRNYEPSYTYGALSQQRNWVDFEGNREAVDDGLRLVEKRGILSSKQKHLKIPKVSDDDVEDLLGVMTSANPGQHLFFVTPEGQFRLGRRRIRDAIEVNVGAVTHVREPGQEGRRVEFEPETTGAEVAVDFDQVAEEDELAAVVEFLRDQRDRDGADDLEILAIENFLAISNSEDETNIASVSEANDVNRETFARKVRNLRERLNESRDRKSLTG